jgi:hypothetical protein
MMHGAAWEKAREQHSLRFEQRLIVHIYRVLGEVATHRST